MGQPDQVEQDLRSTIVNEGVDVDRTQAGSEITLQARTNGRSRLIVSEGFGQFHLKDDLGNLRNGFQTKVIDERPCWGLAGPPLTESEMLAKAKGWIKKQRRSP